jgi:predicted nucleotidyltransferase component of viral defense system
MQTYLQIKSRYSEDVIRRNPEAILKEYLQYELLDSIFKQKGSEKLSFIGGTAIRIVYGSARFSEDLDFDNFGLSFEEFGKMLNEVIKDMENKGFLMEFRIVEKGAYHGFIKFPEILKMNGLPNQPGEKILIRIDAVHKKKNVEPRQFILDGFDVYRRILVNPIDVILSQKLITIIQRKREKGRDFYDASFLLGSTEPNYGYIEKQYEMNKSETLDKLHDKLNQLDFKDLAKDVLPLLIKPEDQERVLSFKEYSEQRLK